MSAGSHSGGAGERPRLLVIGSSGQVGWELLRSLQPLGALLARDVDTLDLSRPDSLAAVIEPLRPAVIVNAAAYTAVDAAEDDEAVATRVNGEAVGALARIARDLGALLVHYSTDYVFDGSGTAARTESESPAPLNAYGRSKLAGETAALGSGADCLVLRTSWVYASRGRNFLLTVLRLARERESMQVVDDQVGAPTAARLIADVTAHAVRAAMAERMSGAFRSELLHLTARGETSWHGFAEAALAYARRLAPAGTFALGSLAPIPTSQWPARAVRPLNSRLCVDRIEARFGLRLPPWEEGMRLCVEEWALREGHMS